MLEYRSSKIIQKYKLPNSAITNFNGLPRIFVIQLPRMNSQRNLMHDKVKGVESEIEILIYSNHNYKMGKASTASHLSNHNI